MTTSTAIKSQIKSLKSEYDKLRKGKNSLLTLIDESELSESVFNSNAIENSTLSLKETERILLELEISRNVSIREVFEAKNLARIMKYTKSKLVEKELTIELMLLMHKMLLSNINDDYAGRFRTTGEYVRVGTHIAPAPEKVERMIDEILLEFAASQDVYFIDSIAKFHLDFETTHPYCDGNGRMGRVIINYQLMQHGYPNIIIRDKEKQLYYTCFNDYKTQKKTTLMEKVIILALMESMHKRIAYLKGETIKTLSEFAKVNKASINSFLNAARRQTIPAFREKGVWHIGEYKPKKLIQP